MSNLYKNNQRYISDRLEAELYDLENFPKYFLIETVNICNARCIMCPVEISLRKKGYMTDTLFEKILKDIKERNKPIRQVALFLLGEPLLDNKIFNRIKLLKEMNIDNILLSSNASLLTSENILKLIQTGLDQIYISIDGYEKKTYESIKKGLHFEKVYANVQNLFTIRNEVHASLRIRLQFILQKENFNEREPWQKFWRQYLGPKDEIKVIKVSNWGSQLDINDFSIGLLSRPCISPFGTFVIQYDGKVSLCCADFDCKVNMGDLNNQSIVEIWQSEKFKKIRSNFLHGIIDIPLCKKCNVWREDKYYD